MVATGSILAQLLALALIVSAFISKKHVAVASHFHYILLLLIWHMYLYIMHC